MSRIGKLPITIPAGVTINYSDNVVSVKGPKGEMSQAINPSILVKISGTEVTFEIDEAADNSFGQQLLCMYRDFCEVLY